MAGTIMNLDKRAKQRLGAAIKRLREKNGLTRQDLANRVGVKECTIFSWESANQAPILENAVILARALGAPLSELLSPELEERAKAKGLGEYELSPNTLKMLRIRANLNVRTVAQETGIGEATLLGFEQGTRTISVFDRLSLEKYYHEKIDQQHKAIAELQAESAPAQPRITPKLKEEFAPKQEQPAQKEQTPVIQMIPRDTTLSGFRQSIVDSLIREAKVSTDPAVKKLADVLALIDEYEGERSGERRNESQVA